MYLKLICLVLSVNFFESSSGQLSKRIINGSLVDISNFPYQVALQVNQNHHCGGSLISEEFVLTAAHCEKIK